MAPPFAATDLTTQSPRTSLIDAEWEWLARRADVEEASDGVAFTDRDTAPGLAPFSQASPPSWQEPLDSVPAHVVEPSWRGRRMELAFVAAILLSFAFGVVALPIGKSVVSRLQQDLWTDGYEAQLDLAHATANNSMPVTAAAPQPAVEAPKPAAAEPQNVVAVPAQPQVMTAPVELAATSVEPAAPKKKAKPVSGPKSVVARSAPHRWTPPPRRPASDNPY